jgi:DNA-binding NarL/FixJ family response regulator
MDLRRQEGTDRKTTATPRQAEIMELVRAGFADKEIARQLGVSARTVRTHLEIYYRRTRQHNRIGALRAYQDWLASQEAPIEGGQLH